jgi:hypothetical protein
MSWLTTKFCEKCLWNSPVRVYCCDFLSIPPYLNYKCVGKVCGKVSIQQAIVTGKKS